MFRFLASFAILGFVGVLAWAIGSKLSADALALGVGVVFGVLAGIPVALLLLASQRASQARRDAPQAPQAPRAHALPQHYHEGDQGAYTGPFIVVQGRPSPRRLTVEDRLALEDRTWDDPREEW